VAVSGGEALPQPRRRCKMDRIVKRVAAAVPTGATATRPGGQDVGVERRLP